MHFRSLNQIILSRYKSSVPALIGSVRTISAPPQRSDLSFETAHHLLQGFHQGDMVCITCWFMPFRPMIISGFK